MAELACEARVTCPYCGRLAELVRGDELFCQRRLHRKDYWRCAPCGAHVGCHKGTTMPFGSLADVALRRLRQKAHITFDRLWKTGLMSRVEAYRWMKDSLPIQKCDAHIGMFKAEQCRQLIEAVAVFGEIRRS